MATEMNPKDTLIKVLIEKGLLIEAEFMQKLSAERAGYQELLRYLPRLRSCVNRGNAGADLPGSTATIAVVLFG